MANFTGVNLYQKAARVRLTPAYQAKDAIPDRVGTVVGGPFDVGGIYWLVRWDGLSGSTYCWNEEIVEEVSRG